MAQTPTTVAVYGAMHHRAGSAPPPAPGVPALAPVRPAPPGPAVTLARPVHHLEDVMGTIVTIDVYTSRDATAAEIDEVRCQLTAARAILQRAVEVFSTWQPGSAISRLRRQAITVADAPAEVAD